MLSTINYYRGKISSKNGPSALVEAVEAACKEGVANEHLLGVLSHARFSCMLGNEKGRVQLITIQYQAVMALLCCHADITGLSNFFQDKARLLADFVELIRTGPGNQAYDPSILPLEIRVLACRCLVALVDTHQDDNFNMVGPVSVMGRFSGLQHDLGVNRGQYMGMLPCLLRASSAFLTNLSSDGADYLNSGSMDVVLSEASGLRGFSQQTAKDEARHLAWIEQILILTEALVGTPTGSVLPALTDNGFLISLMTVLKLPRRNGRHDNQRAFIDSIIVSILDRAVCYLPASLHVFSRQKGAKLCLGRVLWELEWLASQEGLMEAPSSFKTTPTPRKGRKAASSTGSSNDKKEETRNLLTLLHC